MYYSEIQRQVMRGNRYETERPRKPFDAIARDFFPENFSVGGIVDYGPGQWDMCDLIAECVSVDDPYICGIDKDDQILALGALKGYDVIRKNLREVCSLFPATSLLGKKILQFCKFSINARWWDTPDDHLIIATHFARSGKAWIAPWNGGATKEQCEWQKRAFKDRGFNVHEISERDSAKYGVHGDTTNRIIFTKGLKV